MMLFIHSFSHFLVDALCITTLFSGGVEGAPLLTAIVLYNTLAFSTQCVVGILVDRLKCERQLDAASMLIVALGFAVSLPFLARVTIVAIGNSVFHVSAGAATLKTSGGLSWKLGVFVAPGAIGVTLGTCFPQLGWFIFAGLLLCAAAACCMGHIPQEKQMPVHLEPCAHKAFPLAAVLLLTCAVAVRAVGGSIVSFSWKNGVGASFLMTACVFAGKFLGGFVCDKCNPRRTALLSLPAAAICIAFFSDSAVLSLSGQFLLNLTMPVTLWLLYCAMPDSPGFAFGLAASALWPGTIAGVLIHLAGPALWCCVICCFVFGLLAILYSTDNLGFHERRK